ncbi:MAG: hypothetical protein JWM32_2077 [Verrucomicrobia bacterium]|nr:hypothetical protein [Verrucomicrobiota bacterium]
MIKNACSIVLQALAKYDCAIARSEVVRFLSDRDSGILLKASALATLGPTGQPVDHASS